MTVRVEPEVHKEYCEHILQMFGNAEGEDKNSLEYAYMCLGEFGSLISDLGPDYAMLGVFTKEELDELKAKLAEKRQEVEDDIVRINVMLRECR